MKAVTAVHKVRKIRLKTAKDLAAKLVKTDKRVWRSEQVRIEVLTVMLMKYGRAARQMQVMNNTRCYCYRNLCIGSPS